MQQEWPNEEEKEQSSPVSILDCPFQDEEEETGSPFQRSLIHVEGIPLSLSLSLSRLSHDLLDRNVVASSMKTYNATRAKLWALEIGSREEL